MRRLCIITADDFGLHPAVNEAVEAAYRTGVLTATSLMVGAPAVQDAAERARALPGLRVGLHLTLADGTAVLPRVQIPDLVDADNRFHDNMAWAGWRFFALPKVRAQLAAEIRAQFAAFAGLGLTLDHLDAHKHFHLHPTVLSLALSIGREYGLRAVRVPAEPGLTATRLLRPWLALMRARLRRAGMAWNDQVYGLAHSGRMDEAQLVRILAALPSGVTEIYLHPATVSGSAIAPSMVGYRHHDELTALLSPVVRTTLRTAGIQLGSYADIARIPARRAMTWWIRIALLLGTVLGVALVLRGGLHPILALLSGAGWVLLWLVPLHALPLLLDVLGWRTLLRAVGAVFPVTATTRLFLIASVREAVNRLLPVANVGGEIVGIRMLCRIGGNPVEVAASVVAEVLLTIISQLLFAAAGVLMLLHVMGKVAMVTDLMIALALALPLLAGLYMLIHRGSVFERILRGVLGTLDLNAHLQGLLGQAIALDASLRQLLGRTSASLATIGWQLSGLLTGVIETWLALRWLQHPVGFGTALALESLTQAIRHFIFVVPAGVGVQEAGLVGFGYFLGLGNDVSIALSLAKRMREIVFGVPALVYWQLA